MRRPIARGAALLFATLSFLAAPCFVPPALAVARGSFQNSGNPAAPLGALTLRLVRLPVGWIAGWVRGPQAATVANDGTTLAREGGWTTLGFPLQDSGRGVVLEIRGRTEIGPVEIVFADGDLERVEHSSGRAYGRGQYELADFGAERRVLLVRFAARARSPRASMKVLLLRDEPYAVASGE